MSFQSPSWHNEWLVLVALVFITCEMVPSALRALFRVIFLLTSHATMAENTEYDPGKFAKQCRIVQ